MAEKQSQNADENDYTAESIQVLEGLEAVRKRPAMYIGDTDKKGLHHLIYEVVDNSIDEALAGFAKNIEVILKTDGSASVRDDGRGIPTEKHSMGKSALEVVTTVLHAGGKFEKKAYKVSGGLHGVGISVVNALSEWMEAEVHRGGKIYRQRYARGTPTTQVEVIGETGYRGTIVRFKPDGQIFPAADFDYETIKERLRELAFLNRGVRIGIKDERGNLEETFFFEGGLVQFVEYLNKTRTKLHQPLYFKKEVGNIEAEIALQYTASYSESIYSFANDIKTVDGGTHVSGFRTGLTRVLNDYGEGSRILKEGRKIAGDDAAEGLTAVISVKVPEPQFEGQTKGKLGNSEIKGYVDSFFSSAFRQHLEENPLVAKIILAKCMSAMEAREAAQKAKDLIRRKSVFESSVLPGKLADCSEEDPAKSELFVVEGDSAGGCFSGDTKVALADGRNLSFRELVEEGQKGKQNFCYTIKEDGRIGIAPIIHPRVTRRNAKVIRLIIDNGEEIVCTPDHQFMLRNSSYRKAEELAKSTSLMPLYRQYSKPGKRITIEGYDLVYDPKESRWVFTHILADEYNLLNGKYGKEKNSCVHHIDFDKLNNNPTNLRRMGKQEHLDLHASVVKYTMTRPEVLEKIRKAHQSEEYRERIRATMRSPKMRKMLSERAKKQWTNEDYKQYMTERFIEFYRNSQEYRNRNNELLNQAQQAYWSNLENRKKQATRVSEYFNKHPEKREHLSHRAEEQWNNEELVKWRSRKTKEQWTPEFRARRKATYDLTYKEKALKLMRTILDKDGELKKERYEEERRKTSDRSILRYDTICERFFDTDENRLKETVVNYNHKISEIVELNERMDVYDLEVEGTHNFALASGIFVHNSSKQGRDRRFQAILPLKGKILNVEKAPLNKILMSNEIRNVVLSLGTGFGSDFDLKKLRYHKIIIMSVDYDEPTMVKGPDGKIMLVKVGAFIDAHLDDPAISDYKILCFEQKTNKTAFKPIRKVIRHKISEHLYEISASYGRKIRVTSSHSVFTYENGKIVLKKTSELKEGDYVVAPRQIHLDGSDSAPAGIDLVEELHKYKDNGCDIFIRHPAVLKIYKRRLLSEHSGESEMTEPRIEIPLDFGAELAHTRSERHLSQREICSTVGIKQPTTFYQWERGINKPTLSNFNRYVALLGFDAGEALKRVRVVRSRLEYAWQTQFRNSGRNRVKDYIRLNELSLKEIAQLPKDVTLSPTHYAHKGVNRTIPVDEELMFLLGFFLAEGSCSQRNGVRFAIGSNDSEIAARIKDSLERIFGVEAKRYSVRSGIEELRVLNSAVSLLFRKVFGFDNTDSTTKKIPSIIFNSPKGLQIAFLNGYLRGDGTVSENGLHFTTSSKELANGLLYLLLSHGVIASVSEHVPDGKVRIKKDGSTITTKNKFYSISVVSKEDIMKLKPVWTDHHLAGALMKKMDSDAKYGHNRKFVDISGDLVGLRINAIEKVESAKEDVYDFSVEEGENFISGFGGLCAHNTDADVDGAHIRTLLLTLFYRHFKPLIENGHIYAAMPPLYRAKKGKSEKYAYNDGELAKALAEFGGDAEIQRYKGLGEMNAIQLWETTMDPETRTLKKITIEDAMKADEMFSLLMGDAVEPRRAFIEQYAREVRNLDI